MKHGKFQQYKQQITTPKIIDNFEPEITLFTALSTIFITCRNFVNIKEKRQYTNEINN